MTQRLLAVFAHPDDETFLAGGTLALYADRGWNVRLICTTRGDAGQRGPYTRVSVPEFGSLRIAELEAACDALRIGEPQVLDWPDGGVRQVVAAVQAMVADLLQGFEPHVVMTFGPDGISGHADHLAVHVAATAAFGGWQDVLAARDSMSGSARQARLYYVLRSAAVPACCRPRGAAPPPVTTLIDISSVGRRKWAAAQCHRSQRHLHPATDEEIRTILTSPEHFHRAAPAWRSPATTLEAGLWAAGSPGLAAAP